MNKPLILTFLMALSGCSLHEIKTAELLKKIGQQTINEGQVLSAHYCTMGFIEFENKRYKHFDSYTLKKCVVVHTREQLIFLPRKGASIGTPEYLVIDKGGLLGMGLWKEGEGRQIQLQTEDGTLVLELLKDALWQDAKAADALFEIIRRSGTRVFDITQPALPVAPQYIPGIQMRF